MRELKKICSTVGTIFGIYLSLLVLSLLLAFLAGCGSENPVASGGALAPSSTPNKVLDAANKAVPGGEVTGTAEEKEDGRTVYEVQKLVDGVEYEIEVTANGEVLEVEEGDDDSWWAFWD